jgi:hypothetical protein
MCPLVCRASEIRPLLGMQAFSLLCMLVVIVFPNNSGPGGVSTGTFNPMATTDKGIKLILREVICRIIMLLLLAKGLVQRQKDIIKLQDEMILDIGAGVDRLHMQVYMITYTMQ